MALRIEDYALIGNFHTAALVGRDGSIDWLCLPGFDSGAIFSSLLGKQSNGFWKIQPSCPFETKRSYVDGTLVLQTEFRAEHGTAKLTDFMVPHVREADVIRVVEVTRGEVPMQMELRPRFDYGSIVPLISSHGDLLSAIAGPDLVQLRSPVPLHLRNSGQNDCASAEWLGHEGEVHAFALKWQRSYRREPGPIHDPARALDETIRWWRNWSSQSTYRGKWKAAVDRSLITLKALTYAPSGGMVAAPTTSLPEKIGGIRNWDYRYCWLRDTTLCLYALISAGFHEEARAWREWLLRAIAGHPGDIRIMYGIRGERRLLENKLPWLEGYEHSSPARTGNAAYEQFQLDIYGEIANTLYLASAMGLEEYTEERSWKIQRGLLEHLEQVWHLPDHGMWEVRGPGRQFTQSKVMAWAALDRGIRAAERVGLHAPIDRWTKLREKIHDEVCAQGYNSELGSFVQSYGSDRLDASILLMPIMGFLPFSDPRVVNTVRRIEERLMVNGFVLRYHPKKSAEVDGLPPGEGVFLPCTLWLANCWAQMGRRSEAIDLFEKVLAIRNDVGLLSEEYDPIEGRLLGNFPQAFSHVTLVNDALLLSGYAHPLTESRRAA